METLIADRNWIWFLTAGLICGAVTAELLRRHRLKRFGEPGLLGLRTGWMARLVPGILVAAAVTAAASIIPQSEEQRWISQDRVQSLSFLVDSGWVEPDPGNSTLLAEAIRTTTKHISGLKVSVYLSGTAAETLVPASWDCEGVHVLAERISLGWQRIAGPGDLQASLNSIAVVPGDERRDRAIVILTGLSAEEMERRALVPPDGTRLLCLLTSAGAPAQVGACSPEGNWTWAERAESMPALLESHARPTGPVAWLRSRDFIQLLAAGGLLLLAVEFLWVLLLEGRRSLAG
jgi:hypothetical protein